MGFEGDRARLVRAKTLRGSVFRESVDETFPIALNPSSEKNKNAIANIRQPSHKGYAKKIYPRKSPILSGFFPFQSRDIFVTKRRCKSVISQFVGNRTSVTQQNSKRELRRH